MRPRPRDSGPVAFLSLSPVLALPLHAAIVLAIAVRVVMRRPARGIALSWLLLVAAFPFVGALVYLLIAERRIARRRARGIDALPRPFRQIPRATLPAG